MKKTAINPWTWQEKPSYVQAVEVKSVEATPYVSGQQQCMQTASTAMPNRVRNFTLAIQNLETCNQSGGLRT